VAVIFELVELKTDATLLCEEHRATDKAAGTRPADVASA
jgi:hypothetical protein